MKLDKKEIIEHFKVFDALNSEELIFLFQKLKLVTLSKYDFLYYQGHEAKSIFILYDGSVKVGRMAGDGREAIKEVLHTYNILGSTVLHGESVRQDFVQALNRDAYFLELSLEDLKYFMRVNHNFSLNIIRFLSKKLAKLENRMATLMIHDARGRIIDFIKSSAVEQGRRVGEETLIRHSLTQQEIANITGTSRQTVTHVLNDLKKSNLIYFNRKSILVRDLAKLA